VDQIHDYDRIPQALERRRPVMGLAVDVALPYRSITCMAKIVVIGLPAYAPKQDR
jgi:hypothetical protein